MRIRNRARHLGLRGITALVAIHLMTAFGFSFAPSLPPAGSEKDVLGRLVDTAADQASQHRKTADEDAIVSFIDAHQAEALHLLEQAVNINSGTMNFEGVRQVGELFGAEFNALGFETTWIDGTPFGRAGHLIAEREGRGPHLVLVGHLDTVFEPESPFQRFEMLDDSTARGPGIIDMKGGIVIMIHALRALEAVGALDDIHVTAVLHGDEEKSGDPLPVARQALVNAAIEADIALGFENGDSDPRTAVIARRGWTGWTLQVEGTPAHSSLIFREDVGAGAIYEAARVLHDFYNELPERYLTFNPGIFIGGTEIEHDPEQDRGSAFGKDNVIAEHAIVSGDLRTISADQLENARWSMEKIVSRHHPHTRSTITFEEGYPPMAPSDGNRRLLELYSSASEDLGFGPVAPVDPQQAGAADISFTAGHVEMAIDGIGLMGSGGHTVKETANLRTLPSQTKRAAVLMYRLSRGWQER